MPLILSFVVLSLRVLISGRCASGQHLLSTLVIGSWIPTSHHEQYVLDSPAGDAHAGDQRLPKRGP